MELTQNNALNVDRKPGSTNRLPPLSSVYSEQLKEANVEFWHFRGVHPQDDVIINQDLRVLVFTQNPIVQHFRYFEFQKWLKMKHPNIRLCRLREKRKKAHFNSEIW